MATKVKVSTLETEIRDLIGDDKTPYRHPPANLYRYMTAGTSYILGDQPEAQYIDSVTHDDVVPITAADQYLQISSDYVNALRDYVISKVMAEDSEDSANLALSNNALALSDGEV